MTQDVLYNTLIQFSEGMKSAEIAEKMYISKSTAQKQLIALRKKKMVYYITKGKETYWFPKQ